MVNCLPLIFLYLIIYFYDVFLFEFKLIKSYLVLQMLNLPSLSFFKYYLDKYSLINNMKFTFTDL